MLDATKCTMFGLTSAGYDGLNAQHNRCAQYLTFAGLDLDDSKFANASQIYNSNAFGMIKKFKRRRRKMTAKFIKFAGEVINITDVIKFGITKPEEAFRKFEVWAAFSNDDFDALEEYYNTIEEAQARLDAICAQVCA